MISAQDHQCCHLVTRHLRNFNSCLGDFLTQDIQYRCHVSSKQGEKYHTQGKYLQMIYHLKNAATKTFQPLSTRLVRNIMVNFKPGGYMRKMIFHSIESLSLNQSQSTHAPTLCDYFSSSTSASDSDNLILTTSKAECKRRSRKRNRNAVFTR